MSRITAAREAEKLLRMRWEAKKAQEWEALSATVKAEVAGAVWDARQAGISVAQIAREYGTTNRGTIYDILKEQEALRNYAAQESGTTTVTPLRFVPLDTPGHFEVHAHGWRSDVNPASPYTGVVGIKITPPSAPVPGAVLPLVGETYDVGTALFRELQAWRTLDPDNPTVVAFTAATGLTREGGQ